MKDLDDSEKFIGYAIKIKAELDKRISEHIYAIKQMQGKSYSKKKWVEEAIQEKLKEWENIDFETIKSDCTLNFIISQATDAKIIRIVEILKKLKIKSNKTDFILEAINEKLEKEEERVKKLFQDMVKAAFQTQEKLL